MINLKVKSMFFDAKKVIDAMDKATRRALAKAGGSVRTTARRSIRKTKNNKIKSQAGQAPRSRTGLLRNSIFFGFDRSSSTVIIGPARKAAKGRDVPHTLEFGGTITMRDGKRARIAPRPFMAPALKKLTDKNTLPKMWRNSIKGR